MSPLPSNSRKQSTSRPADAFHDLLRSAVGPESHLEFLTAVIEAIPTPILVKDAHHRYCAVNAAFIEFFAHSADEVLGKDDDAFFSAEDAAFYRETDRRAMQQAEVVEYERPYLFAGRTHWMLVRKSALRLADGQQYVVLVLIDVTKRRAAEERLRESEARFRSLNELSVDWYWEQDEHFRFTFLSSHVDLATGQSAASALGHTRWEAAGIDWAAADWEAHKATYRDHKPFRNFVYKRTGADGTPRWLDISGEPIIDEAGRFRGYRGVGRDVTRERQAAKEIRHIRDLYAALSHTNRAIIHIRDRQALLEEVCRIAVEHGHFCLVWIGLLDEQTKWLKRVVVSGPASAGYPEIRVSIDPALPEGRGYSAAALREGRPYVLNDYFADERTAPWWDVARTYGIRSLATLPLKQEGRCVGVLNVHGSEAGFFTDALVALLTEMAEDVSFALTYLARESERECTVRALKESEERFRQLASNIPEVFWIADPNHQRLVYVSPAYERVWGRKTRALLEQPSQWLDSVHHEDRNRVAEVLLRSTGEASDYEYRIQRPDGSIRWIHDRAFPVFNEHGKLVLMTGIAEDITRRKEADDRLLQLAHYDHLTGLPNRVLLHERLKQALARAARHNDHVATVFLDLDHFKTVNDTLGHATGDHLLQQVAKRITRTLRDDDTVARLGGDEFAVILSDISQPQGAEIAVEKIVSALQTPFAVDGHELYVSASAGISMFPTDGSDADSLLKNADTAMYRAKELGRTTYQFFSQEMNQRARDRLSLESQLRRAIEREEFTLHYQPKVEVHSGRITGCEALLRWHNPEVGLVPPSRFIPLLEENGGIVKVGEWVLHEICRQLKQWSQEGLAPCIALNLSARQFYQRDLDVVMLHIVSDTGIDPSLIELEITESMLMQNPEQAARILHNVKDAGMRLSVDDFGTGYSSLSYLKRFPLDALKIDRSFIEDITANADSRAIVQAILALARSLGLRSVAEGVEKEGQLSLLAKLGCDEYQGYYFAKPMPAAELSRLLIPGVGVAA